MNILAVFSDQQHKYALGRVDDQYLTPHLDALADEGTLFSNAYSNNPVCGPFRGCLLTGQYTSHCGLFYNNEPLPEGKKTLADAAAAADWQTGFVGKWHLGGKGSGPIPENLRGGFQRFNGYQCYNGFSPDAPYHNDVVFFDEEDMAHAYPVHRTEVTTELAVEQLKAFHRDSRPFFCLVGYQAPHYPVQPLEKYADWYKDTLFSKTPDYRDTEPYTPTFNPKSPADWTEDPDFQRYGGDMNAYRQLYAAMVSQVDAGVGRLLNTLKELGSYDDTLILFFSDHGDMQGSHGLTNKCVSYEKSAGIPLVVKMPGGIEGQVCHCPVSGVDISATLLEVFGQQALWATDGESLLATLKNGDAPKRDFAICESLNTKDHWRMIRKGKYKLVTAYEDNAPRMLFDLESDPYELCDLLPQADPALVSGLVSVLKEQAGAGAVAR